MPGFVLVVNVANGRKQHIPKHWLDDPGLAAQFRTPDSPAPTKQATPGHRRRSAEKE